MIPQTPREVLLSQIEAEVRMAPREAIEVWLEGSVSIVDFLFEFNKEFIRNFKEMVLATISGADIRDACLRGAPYLAHIWYSPIAAARLEGEVAIIQRFVKDL